MKRTRTKKTAGMITGLLALTALSSTGCSSVRSIFAADTQKDEPKPIENPFSNYNPSDIAENNESMIFRSRHGDGSVEIELPRTSQDVTVTSRAPASEGPSDIDNSYADRTPTQSDRELTRNLSKASSENEERQKGIESGLGLVAAEEPAPERQRSYLASLDHVKQLYRGGRYEAGLIEVDSMIRDFPTDPKLYQMRGTLLDRLGNSDLAVQSWNQSLRFDPKNESLRRFLERRTRQPAQVKSP